MTVEKKKSGAQPGNINPTKGMKWQKALERALSRMSNKDIDTGLDVIADKVVRLAKRGDNFAIREIADRMDGKAVQAVEYTGQVVNYDVALLGILGVAGKTNGTLIEANANDGQVTAHLGASAEDAPGSTERLPTVRGEGAKNPK